MQVALSGLGHRFGSGPWLFRGVDLALEPGRTYAITGPSGSGKSTLLSVVAGWEKPAEGAVTRLGVDTVAWVFQNPFGVPYRNAADHVALPLLAQGLSAADADRQARTIMARFRLGRVADQPFGSLSGGEGQRLMLARAVAAAPHLLLVDEPTAQLDMQTSTEVNAVLAELAADDAIVVVATHDEATRDACTDHIDLHRYVATSASTPGTPS